MAVVDFNSINNSNSAERVNDNVGYFKLKDDGDTAIVRIMHSDVNSFDMLSVHNVNLNGKWVNVNCIREANQPTSSCPLCSKGEQLRSRIFIKVIRYTQDEQGNIIATPEIWDRPISYAKKLADLMADYGDLTEHLFRVRRNGKAGTLQVDYTISYIPTTGYNAANYPADIHLFDTYKTLGRRVYDKNYDELVTFINTGSFPAKENTQADTTPVHTPTNQPYAYSNTTAYSSQPVNPGVVQPPMEAGVPFESSRPIRRY